MTIERREGTREVLLEAATRLFGERGYRAVSTRDLAEAAGVNLAAIQYHFGSKAKLFIEVIDTLMAGSGCLANKMQLLRPVENADDAAGFLGEFVMGFLGYALDPNGPRGCQMMMREVLTDHSEDPSMLETLVSSVAEKFMKPMHGVLTCTLTMLAPERTQEELDLCADSIIGQCTFYPAHRLFLERLKGPDVFSEAGTRLIASHITTFSLRGLQCSEETVQRVSHLIIEQHSPSFSSEKKL